MSTTRLPDGDRGPRPERVVMITTSYPRFPGDTVGTFMEPIAHGLAALGHDIHVVLPWHPRLARPPREGGVSFHPFRYAPFEALNTFGYAAGLKADVRLRLGAILATPLAFAAAWRKASNVAREIRATLVHAHWVVPGGVIGASMTGSRPLVISLHGSDVFVAERHAVVGAAARAAFRRAAWVTACSADLRARAVALGAPEDRSETIPYGVDAMRFKPDAAARARVRAQLGIGAEQPLVAAAGRLVKKKGFEYLIDAVAEIAGRRPDLRLVIGGGGDLESELRERASARGIGGTVLLAGVMRQDEVAALLAAADIVAAPSVKDDSGNVDGLPNVVMESLASGTPLITTAAGGIGAVARDGENALVVAERDPAALARAIEALLEDRALRARIGQAARAEVVERHSWQNVARRFEQAYISGRSR